MPKKVEKAKLNRVSADSKKTEPKIPRIKTGVPGLDEILKGGLRDKNSLLISGGPGTGKSILALQILLEGARQGEPGLCILYDNEVHYVECAQELGLELQKYIDNGTITLIKQPLLGNRITALAIPLEVIRKKKIKRVLLDSLTMFAYLQSGEDKEYRKEIIKFLQNMQDVTLIATSESYGPNVDDNNFKAEDFLFDGVIFLTKVRQEATFERVLHVSKLRGQQHLMNLFPFTIEQGGVKVYPDQVPFSLYEGVQDKNGKSKKHF